MRPIIRRCNPCTLYELSGDARVTVPNLWPRVFPLLVHKNVYCLVGRVQVKASTAVIPMLSRSQANKDKMPKTERTILRSSRPEKRLHESGGNVNRLRCGCLSPVKAIINAQQATTTKLWSTNGRKSFGPFCTRVCRRNLKRRFRNSSCWRIDFPIVVSRYGWRRSRHSCCSGEKRRVHRGWATRGENADTTQVHTCQ